MELKDVLKEAVNSALISGGNNDSDNGFFGDTVSEIERGLKNRACRNL